MGNHGTWHGESDVWCENPFQHLTRLRSGDTNQTFRPRPDLVTLRFIHVNAKTSNLRDCFYILFSYCFVKCVRRNPGPGGAGRVTEGGDWPGCSLHTGTQAGAGDTTSQLSLGISSIVRRFTGKIEIVLANIYSRPQVTLLSVKVKAQE